MKRNLTNQIKPWREIIDDKSEKAKPYQNIERRDHINTCYYLKKNNYGNSNSCPNEKLASLSEKKLESKKRKRSLNHEWNNNKKRKIIEDEDDSSSDESECEPGMENISFEVQDFLKEDIKKINEHDSDSEASDDDTQEKEVILECIHKERAKKSIWRLKAKITQILMLFGAIWFGFVGARNCAYGRCSGLNNTQGIRLDLTTNMMFWTCTNHECKREKRIRVQNETAVNFELWKKNNMAMDQIPDDFKEKAKVVPFCEMHMRPYDLSYDTMMIFGFCGTNKTGRLEEAIRKYHPTWNFRKIKKKMKYLLACSRITLSLGFLKRFPGFKLYSNKNTTYHERKLICTIDSIWKYILDGSPLFVGFDEFGALLEQIHSVQNLRHREEIWSTFVAIVKIAKKLVIMEAFPDERIFNFIRETRDLSKTIVYQNTFQPKNRPENKIKERNVFVYRYKNTMASNYLKVVRKIHENTFKGKNHTFRNIQTGEKTKYTCAWFIGNSKKEVEAVQKQASIKYPGLKSLLLTSESDKEIKESTKNVDEEWKKYSLIFYTPTVEVGVNYLGKVDVIFGYFTPESSNYNSALQMMHRARVVLSGEFHFHIKPSQLKTIYTKKMLMEALHDQIKLLELTKHGIGSGYRIIERDFNTGNYVYDTKSLSFKTLFDHELHELRSKALFAELFIYWNMKMGNKIIYVDEDVDKKEKKTIKKERKEAKKQIKEEKKKLIIESPEINEEERVEIKKKIEKGYIPTKTESFSNVKFDLCHLYDVKHEDITSEFLDKYLPEKRQKIFKFFKYHVSEKFNIGDKESTRKWICIKTLETLCNKKCESMLNDRISCINMINTNVESSELEKRIDKVFQVWNSRISHTKMYVSNRYNSSIIKRKMQWKIRTINGFLDSVSGLKFKPVYKNVKKKNIKEYILKLNENFKIEKNKIMIK